MSPTISSMRSSIETRPSVPPYSSITSARWICWPASSAADPARASTAARTADARLILRDGRRRAIETAVRLGFQQSEAHPSHAPDREDRREFRDRPAGANAWLRGNRLISSASGVFSSDRHDIGARHHHVGHLQFAEVRADWRASRALAARAPALWRSLSSITSSRLSRIAALAAAHRRAGRFASGASAAER